MLRKSYKNLIVLIGLFLTFFCYSSVGATTIYYQDDFDSYIANHLVDEYSNWYSTDEDSSFTPSVVSSSNHYTSAFNSLQFSYRNFIRYSFDSPYLTSFYVSADILLITPSSEGDPNYFSFGVGSYNYVDFSCNMDANGVLTGLVIHSSDYFYSDDYVVNQLCNGVFNNIGAYFEIDSLNNRIIVSSFINGELYSTTFHPSYNSTAFYDMSIGGSAMEPIYFDNFVIADELVGGSSEPINAVCGISNGGIYDYDNPPINLCSTGTSDNFTFTPRSHYLTSTWDWTCLGENGGTDKTCLAYLDASVVLDGVCGAYSGQTFDSIDDFKVWDQTDNLNKCSVGAYAGESVSTSTNKIGWFCSGINYGESVFCQASLSTDIIFGDFDISGGDIIAPSFDEDLVNKNWFVSAMTYLFTPRQETLQDTFNLFDRFQASIPWGYFFLIGDAVNGFIDVSQLEHDIPHYEIVLVPNGEAYTLFDYDDFILTIGIDNFLTFYNFFKIIFAMAFVYFIIIRAKRFITHL